MNSGLQREFDAEKPEHALRSAERMLLAYTTGFANMQQRLHALRETLSHLEDPLERSYWLSRIEFLLGWLAGSAGSRRTAIDHYQRTANHAFAALTVREFSDAYRLFADATGQLMTLRGIFYQLTNGTRARDAALRAVELDWNNRRAHISVGAWYMNAPELAGGTPRYAVEILTQVALQREAQDIERFLAHGFRALACEEIQDHEAAEHSYYAALALFPENPWLPQIAAELELPE